MSFREEQIGRARLILADCREVLPTLSDIDRVVTDVPYGVSSGSGSGLRKGSARGAKSDYGAAFTDNREYIEKVVVPAIETCCSLAASVAVTTGLKNMWLYPEPKHVGSFQYRGSTVMSAWGPMLWQPVLFYGRDPHQGQLRPDSRPNCNDVDRDTPHPCPKPLKQWQWLVERASLAGETVLDPFMGSGTTGVACHVLGERDFVGIELDERYFDLACRRIEDAQKQGDLFIQGAAA
jgi:site-specific DNA-methyltransferase (adenine-specific)